MTVNTVKSCHKWRAGSGIKLKQELPSYREMLALARSLGVPKQELDALLDTHEYFLAAEAWADGQRLK